MPGAQLSTQGLFMLRKYAFRRFVFAIAYVALRTLPTILLLVAWNVTYGTDILLAQGSAGSKAPFESRVIVDMPTAGLLPKGSLGLTTVVFAGGGILCDASFAPIQDFNIGIGYSGVNILGNGSVSWQGIPSTHLRYRIIDETLAFPAIVFGLQTQGRGVVQNKQFETASPGLFASSSKQFSWIGGHLAFHGGLGYSLDLPFNGRGFNAWFGAEQSLGPGAALMAECNPTMNDTSSGLLIHLSLRWVISPGVTLELQGRDLLGTLPSQKAFTRTLSFEINRRL